MNNGPLTFEELQELMFRSAPMPGYPDGIYEDEPQPKSNYELLMEIERQ